MPATWEPLGPATITIGADPGTNFSGEFKNVKITHAYEEIGEARTMLDGTERPATEKRTDGVTGDVENDLTAAGLYQYAYTNDLTQQAIVIEQTGSGATWAGTIKVKLPADVGGDAFGEPIVSAIEWTGVGAFTFTAGTATP